MRLATCDESRRIDELTQKNFGLSDEVLMEAAGALAAREILLSFVSEVQFASETEGIGIVCGPGNNGGDGLVIARHLASAGVRHVTVYLIAPEEKRSPLFRLQLYRLNKTSLRVVDLMHDEQSHLDGKPRLIVDAIFGTGLRSEVRQPYRDWIERLNAIRSPMVSIDTPSGLDVDRGLVLGSAIKATQTITFGLSKPGFYISEGPSRIGRLKILAIGFPREAVRTEAHTCFLFTENLARRHLPKRSATANKTSNGRALIIAGGPGMWGAALLCASSASRMGAGYVTLAANKEPVEVLKTYPEILTAETDDPQLWQKEWSSVAIGPGIGVNDEAQSKIESYIRRAIESKIKNVVLDADALTTLASRKIGPLPSSWIVTPHAGELSRILNVNAKEIESDRLRYAREAARKLGCHVLLKGFRTVVAEPGEESCCWIIFAGNSALAKAGTGDVLTGMIAGLLAQGVEPLKAACTASYIHGRMADEWVRSGGDQRSLQTSDLREFLPVLISRLVKSSSRPGFTL